MHPAVEVWVLEARRRNPEWGPRRLVHEASRTGIEPVPPARVSSGPEERVPDIQCPGPGAVCLGRTFESPELVFVRSLEVDA
jgi:hypothetical protein